MYPDIVWTKIAGDKNYGENITEKILWEIFILRKNDGKFQNLRKIVVLFVSCNEDFWLNFWQLKIQEKSATIDIWW